MARLTDQNSEPAYELVQRWLREVIPNSGTLLEPAEPMWTPELLEELTDQFIGQGDVRGDSFTEKLAAQLASASDAAVRLMAEVEVISYVIHWVGATTQKRKLEVINLTLALRNLVDVRVPPAVQEALSPGFCHPGQYLNSSPNLFFAWNIRFATELQKLRHEERTKALDDPWEFKSVTERLDGPDGVRMAMRHLAHPDTFDPIVTPKDFEAIIQRWPGNGRPTDLDRAVLDIRSELTPQFGRNFTWYTDPLKQLWKPNANWAFFVEWGRKLAEAVDLDDLEREFKIRLSERARRAIVESREGDGEWVKSFKSAWLSRENNLIDWMRRDNVVKWVESDPEAARSFMSLIWADDPDIPEAMRSWPVSIPGNPGVRINVVSVLRMLMEPTDRPPVKITALKEAFSLAGWTPPDRDDPMEFLDWAYVFFDEVVRALATSGVRDRLDAQGLVWTMRTIDAKPADWADADWTEFKAFRGGAREDEPRVSDEDDVAEPTSRDITDHLAAAADQLSVPQEYLEELNDRLRHKGQIVLYGPPGTGKTYFAQRFAKAVARANLDAVQMVQFHPSTSYEDFVEGIRPRTVDGELRYELVDGPLKRSAEMATLNPTQDFVLVIDELNRANLPRVFGELLYLLEYRRKGGEPEPRIQLLYRPGETFVLPTNLFIVATMNTADRSVALVDAALRRRFEFFAFFPDREPIKDMLRTWTSKHEVAVPVADFLEAVNEELAQELPRNLLLGPSYVMGRAAMSMKDLQHAWTYGIYPTLEEHFWAKQEILDNWTWSSVSDRFAVVLGTSPDTTTSDDGSVTHAPD